MAFSALQIYYLNRINKIRENPVAAATLLGFDINEGLPEGTLNNDPRPPVRLDPVLTAMAEAYSQEMIDYDFYGHTSPISGTTQDRFDASEYSYMNFGENLSLVPSDSFLDPYYVADLMIDALYKDEGVLSKGHRLAILNADFRDFGIGQIVGEWQGFTQASVLTMLFGLNTEVVNTVVGYVFQDLNMNGYYEAGEGLPAVPITIRDSEGAFISSTTTDENGYLSVPLLTGEYVLTASTPSHDSVMNVTVGNENLALLVFWHPINIDPPYGTLTADVNALLSSNPIFKPLRPINVPESNIRSSYFLSWNIGNVTRVSLNRTDVASSGTQEVNDLNLSSHTLEGFGPAGYLKLTLNIAVKVFPDFTPII